MRLYAGIGGLGGVAETIARRKASDFETCQVRASCLSFFKLSGSKENVALTAAILIFHIIHQPPRRDSVEWSRGRGSDIKQLGPRRTKRSNREWTPMHTN